MKGEEADAKVWSTTGEERNTKHALWQAEGQETSMHPEERQRVTEDSGRVGPLRGKYEEEDDNDEKMGGKRRQKRKRKATPKRKRSEIGMSEDRSGRGSISDGTRSGRGSVGRNRTAA